MNTEALIAAATEARLKAYAPYSKFRVGAALLTTDGTIITGCNVENASYGLTICAERVALVKAISDGLMSFQCIAVVTDVEGLTPPCGACRQLLWEFAPNADVILANTHGKTAKYTVQELLPHGFDAKQLEL